MAAVAPGSNTAFDPNIAGLDQYNQPGPIFHPFQKLIPELRLLVAEQFDMPTRFSLAWTCRQYYEAEQEEFDCFAFADKCAELGYRTLLDYSVESGGPFDAETTQVAARHGQMEILKKGRATFGDRLDQCWAVQAALGGHRPILQWLGAFQWDILQVAVNAALGGHTDLAIELARESKDLSREAHLRLIQGAAQKGHLETVKSLHQFALSTLKPDGQDRIDRTFDEEYYLKIFNAGVHYGHVPLMAWTFKKAPPMQKL